MSPRQPEPPVQKRAEETRRRILEAATERFAEKGPDGARVDEIAARARANKERIYARFGSKEGLFAAVLEDVFDTVAAEEGTLLALTEADAPRLAETLLRHYMAVHLRHPHFWRLLAWSNLSGNDAARILGDARREVFAHLRGIYAAGVRAGCYPEGVGFETFLFALMGLSYFAYANRRTLRQTLDLDLAAPAAREGLMAETLRLLRVPPPGNDATGASADTPARG